MAANEATGRCGRRGAAGGGGRGGTGRDRRAGPGRGASDRRSLQPPYPPPATPADEKGITVPRAETRKDGKEKETENVRRKSEAQIWGPNLRGESAVSMTVTFVTQSAPKTRRGCCWGSPGSRLRPPHPRLRRCRCGAQSMGGGGLQGAAAPGAAGGCAALGAIRRIRDPRPAVQRQRGHKTAECGRRATHAPTGGQRQRWLDELGHARLRGCAAR